MVSSPPRHPRHRSRSRAGLVLGVLGALGAVLRGVRASAARLRGIRGGAARRLVAAAGTVLVAGGIPGSRPAAALHPAPRELGEAESAAGHARAAVMVREAPGGAPIPAASVRAYAVDGDRVTLAASRTTDAGGRALVDGLPGGEIWVVADAPGHARGSSHLVIESGRGGAGSPPDGSPPREVTLDLGPEQTMDLLVTDDGNTPVPGAEIEVRSDDDPLPVGARAGADGRAHVGRLGPGPWLVTARAPGFEDASTRVASDGASETIVLRKLGSIDVHVVAGDGDGTPAAGARVLLAGASLWPPRSAEADVRGDVRVGGLPSGVYALRATRGDWASPIELGAPLERGEERSVVLHLAPGRWVRVRVTDGDGDDAPGVPGARITLAEGGLSPFPVEGTTDAQGRARLGPIAAGGATLGARAEGFVSAGVVPVPDPPPAETRVVLARAGALVGRVVDDRGFPIGGATLEVVGSDARGSPIFDDPRRASFQTAHFEAMLGGAAPLVPAGQLGVMPGPVPPIPIAGAFVQPSPGISAFMPTTAASLGPQAPPAEPWVSRADGTFRASPASPGRVQVVARHPQYMEARSAVVTLVPAGEAEVEVVMRRGGAIEGRVVDASDRPVEGARVSLAAVRGGFERATRSARDGTFAFASVPEEVSLAAGDNDDAQPDVQMTVHVPEGERREVTLRLPEARAALPVTVVDDRDWPISGAQVSATSLAPETPLRATAFTDTHGDAALRRASGLALRVEVSAPGHAPRVLQTEAGGDALRVVLALAEQASGEVVAASGGDPVRGADVALTTELRTRRTRTDDHGAYAFDDLPSGPATLRVRAAGFAPASVAVLIPDSAGRRAGTLPRLELPAEAVAEGDVVDGRGDPVAGARVAEGHAPTWLPAGSTGERGALTDARGRFAVHELGEGTVTLEAYAPDVGRGRVEAAVTSGRTTSGLHIVLAPAREDEGRTGAPPPAGGVAVTLGEVGSDVVVVSVAAESEAEQAGVAAGDVLLSVDGQAVATTRAARERLGGALTDDVVLRLRRRGVERLVRVRREAVHH